MKYKFDIELLIAQLTELQLEILRATPYEREVAWSGSKRLVAEFLVDKGLLERHPNAEPPCYRVTDLGERVVQALDRKKSV